MKLDDIPLESVSLASITATDIVILLIVVLSALLAYFRGFAREVLSLGTWLGAGLAAYYGFRYVSPYAREFISSGAVADIATGVGLFLGALVLLTILNHTLSGRIKESALSAIDRGLGLLFGTARGALIICVAYIAATWFWVEEDLPEFVTEAQTLPTIRSGADIVVAWLPEDIRKNIEKATKDAAEKSDQVIQAEQLLRNLNEKAEAAKGAGVAPPSAYNDKERRELQRLINRNQ
jgi:membrane protein required for colicin V production